MDDIHLLTAGELAAAYRSGQLSPVEATEAALARADSTAATLNAFSLLDRMSALEAARASEARWRAGSPRSAFDGVPAAPKDSMYVAGWPTRIASVTTPADDASEDSPYIARLRSAGAVFIGKTTTPEYCWTGWTQSIVHGVTRNPWNLDRTVGGSSGGAGAALAGSVVPLAFGTDSGGSIRTPAGLTGVVGFKPTVHRIPLHALEGYTDFNSAGPLANSMADARLAFAVMDGSDSAASTLAKGTKPLLGLRIAFTATMGYARSVAPLIAAGVRNAAAALADLGAEMKEDAPPIEWPIDTYNTIGWAEQAHNLKQIVQARGDEMERGLVEIVGVGSEITLSEYISAQKQRWSIKNAMKAFLAHYDLLLMPTLPVTAFSATKIAPDTDAVTGMNDWLPFSSIFNMTGQPALSLPFGFDPEGLPFGVQLVGRPFEDWRVLDVAAILDDATGSLERIRRRRAALL